MNLSSLQQKFSLTSNHLGTNSIVVKRVDCTTITLEDPAAEGGVLVWSEFATAVTLENIVRQNKSQKQLRTTHGFMSFMRIKNNERSGCMAITITLAIPCVIFNAFFCRLMIVFKINYFEKFFEEYHPDLGPICLQRLWAY